MYVEVLLVPHWKLQIPCKKSIVSWTSAYVCNGYGSTLGTGAPVALLGNISCLAPFEPILMNQDYSKQCEHLLS